jgi:hypothetical protein
LQEVAFETLVFEEGRHGGGKLRFGAGGLSHYDQKSDNDGQEEEGRAKVYVSSTC